MTAETHFEEYSTYSQRFGTTGAINLLIIPLRTWTQAKLRQHFVLRRARAD